MQSGIEALGTNSLCPAVQYAQNSRGALSWGIMLLAVKVAQPTHQWHNHALQEPIPSRAKGHAKLVPYIWSFLLCSTHRTARAC